MDTDLTFSDELIERLCSAERVAAMTGAGISAESGVPTFRGEGGLWKRYRPEELANVHAFVSDPALVWEWYTWRRRLIAETEPNPVHTALVELAQRMKEGEGRFTLITQNVDDLHDRAGSTDILKLHGEIFRSFCMDCGTDHPEVRFVEKGEVPRCEQEGCEGLVRPGVVWFGEGLPTDILQTAAEAAGRAEVFLSIGTSAVVYPAAGLIEQAARSGAYLVEVNVEPSALSSVADEVLLGPAGEVLPALMAEVWKEEGALISEDS